VRLWKVELQKLADETGLTIKVRALPAGHVEMEQDREVRVNFCTARIRRREVVDSEEA
jgi:hypothetical protein